MKFLFFLPLLFFTTSLDLASKHALFTSALSDITPDDIAACLQDIRDLIGIGEASRDLALLNQSIAQGIYDDALGVWQAAYDEEQAALGVQKNAEEAQEAARVAVESAIAFTGQKSDEKDAADNAVPPAEETMNNEIARVDEEKISLLKVKNILAGMIDDASFVQTGRKLLRDTRTVALFTNPSFLSTLENADPEALQQVADIVDNLIEKGEEDRNYAIGEYNDRVSEAAAAAQALTDAQTAQANREQELADAKEHTAEVTEIAQGKSAIEVEKRGIRDAKDHKLDVQKAFTAREIARIDGEKATHELVLTYVGQLKKISELLE